VMACYTTAYGPVLNCQTKMQVALEEPDQAAKCLEEAALADPKSAEPWKLLASIEFAAWWREPSVERFGRFERANDMVLKLEPNSAVVWQASGDWYFDAYNRVKSHGDEAADDILRTAIDAYRRVLKLYPTNERCRAKLAEASREAGKRP
jgi:tetratricopeptide (TPR) repeat protein